MASYLGRADLPRGLRNNNPGNLIKTSIPWVGKITPGTDARFEQFKSLEDGTRAMLMDIINDITKDGKDTIKKLITEYAPPHENNTAAYINQVSKATGLKPDEKIVLSDTFLRNIAQVINQVENGVKYKDYLTTGTINTAISRLPDSLKKKIAIASGISLLGLGVVAGLFYLYKKNA